MVGGITKVSCLWHTEGLGEGLYCAPKDCTGNTTGKALLFPPHGNSITLDSCRKHPARPRTHGFAQRGSDLHTWPAQGTSGVVSHRLQSSGWHQHWDITAVLRWISTSFFTPLKALSLGLQPVIDPGVSRWKLALSAGIQLEGADGIRVQWQLGDTIKRAASCWQSQ